MAHGDSATFRVGIDTGGTFCDFVLADAAGRIVATHKRPSTPEDPALAVLKGLEDLLAKAGVQSDTVQPRVVHGSTVATNALLEGAAEAVAFVTTAGFEDTLHIARQDRPELYALVPRRAEPPVERRACVGVAERVRHDGGVLRELGGDEVARVVDRLRELRPAAVAVSLLHSYANPAHERAVAEAIRTAFGDAVHLTVSHELLPEHREYERAATCVVNAVVAPRMARYIGRLSEALGEERLRVMASHGGVLPPAAVRREPVRTVLSGPAGGALGAAAMTRLAGLGAVITLDMGGTSTDVALIEGDLGARLTTEGEAGGLPVRIPMVDLHTVGAGGGSIAWLDAGGALRVGPQSAGADPGPACYGKQGAILQSQAVPGLIAAQPHLQEGSAPLRGDRAGERTARTDGADLEGSVELLATVTDAHVVLGHIREDQVLGDGMRINRGLAVRAVAAVAERAGLGLEEAALGILRVAEATMARAVQRVSLQRGRDPREHALLPFGGAGGLHACRLAEALGIRRVLAPVHPGLLSAVGMLGAAARHAFSQSVLVRLEAEHGHYPRVDELPAVREALAKLTALADDAMRREGVADADRRDEPSVDLRYVGQSYEITVALDGDSVQAFLAEHERLYGYVAPGKAIEVVTVRLQASGPATPVTLTELPRRKGSAPAWPTVTMHYGDQDETWLLVDRSALLAGDAVEPRTILREYSATTLVPEGWSGVVGWHGQVLLERTP